MSTSGFPRRPKLVSRLEVARRAMDTMGADRIMFSVDYPYEDMAEASEWFESCGISEADRHEIGYENAKRLLRL
ncbi:amidohydrolase family protein [Mycobacterium sp. Root135]|uniref:amidohydrolase family protein n=1 Tax=Mycobacterium sp. Root135 TaxID=1736457 RepID=UPI001F1F2DD2|nr:amidohydrolase family protein [Mycobacterium sp. Root135]